MYFYDSANDSYVVLTGETAMDGDVLAAMTWDGSALAETVYTMEQLEQMRVCDWYELPDSLLAEFGMETKARESLRHALIWTLAACIGLAISMHPVWILMLFCVVGIVCWAEFLV